MKYFISFLLFISMVILIVSCSNDENINDVGIIPTACFTFTDPYILSGIDSTDATTYTPAVFSNCSENAESYYWDFGDSTFSTEYEPTHYYTKDGFFEVKLEAYNEYGSDVLIDTLYVIWDAADKPNIYLYPETIIELTVGLNFPEGGFVTKSIPQISDNIWQISVDTNGKINNEYDFLFYESRQPSVWQLEEGWCINKDSLEVFFTENMQSYNFNERELSDFIEYWIPLLNKFEYYKIYPQYNTEIDKVIEIDFSIEPHNFNRLFYRIIGSNEFSNITQPEITPFDRNGFTVVEWGVVIR